LLHLVYGVLKTGKPFDPNHQPSLSSNDHTSPIAPPPRPDHGPVLA
jgi:hypothetical protein